MIDSSSLLANKCIRQILFSFFFGCGLLFSAPFLRRPFGQLLLSRVMLVAGLFSLRKPCVSLLPDLLVLGRNQADRGACNGSVDLFLLLVQLRVICVTELTESQSANALCRSPWKSVAWGNHSLAPLVLTASREASAVGSLCADSSSRYDLTAMPRAQSTSFKNGRL